MKLPRGPVLALGAFLVTGALVAGVMIWQSRGGGASAVTLTPNDAQVVALGEEIYTAECASCHGADLEGQPNWRERGPDGRLPAPPHNRTGHTFHHADVQLFDLVKHGLPKEVGGVPYVTDMPAYADTLTDDQIIAVLSYIKSRWPSEIRRQHDQLNEQLAGLKP